MNRRDRVFVDRLDAVIRTVGALTPRNPADIAAVFANLRTAVLATKALAQAIAAVRSDDYTLAWQYLDQADSVVTP